MVAPLQLHARSYRRQGRRTSCTLVMILSGLVFASSTTNGFALSWSSYLPSFSSWWQRADVPGPPKSTSGSDSRGQAGEEDMTSNDIKAAMLVSYESYAMPTSHEASKAFAAPLNDWLNRRLDGNAPAAHAGCWRKARLSMEGTCRALSHEANQRLALLLTSCHLQEAGRSTLHCPDDHQINRCLHSLDDYHFHL